MEIVQQMGTNVEGQAMTPAEQAGTTTRQVMRLLPLLPYGTSDKLEAIILAALQARERAVWTKVMKAFDKKFSATDTRLDNTRDYRVDEFYKWCRQHAQEAPR